MQNERKADTRIHLRKIAFLVIIFCLTGYTKISAQESVEKNFSPHHQIGISINHVHVFEGRDDEGNREVLSLPAWGIDYTFQFHEKWAVGLHTDFVIEKFKVEKVYANDEDKETVERSYPVAPGRHVQGQTSARILLPEVGSYYYHL